MPWCKEARGLWVEGMVLDEEIFGLIYDSKNILKYINVHAAGGCYCFLVQTTTTITQSFFLVLSQTFRSCSRLSERMRVAFWSWSFIVICFCWKRLSPSASIQPKDHHCCTTLGQNPGHRCPAKVQNKSSWFPGSEPMLTWCGLRTPIPSALQAEPGRLNLK